MAALVVPKALGYAGIALIPIENGLYAAAAGALIYAVFGTSRQISTGPSSALAAVAASAVVTTGLPPEQAPELVAAVTLVAGLLFVVLAVLKMGWVSRFLSKAVITGFLFGAAIEVVVGELPKLAGTDASGKNAWQEFIEFVDVFDQRHTTTMIVGGGVARRHPRRPVCVSEAPRCARPGRRWSARLEPVRPRRTRRRNGGDGAPGIAGA